MVQQNVGRYERALSAAAGGALLGAGAAKRGLAGGLLAGVGAMLLYRGASGYCGLYQRLGIDTHRRPETPKTITRDELKERLDDGDLDNEDRARGFALVCVLQEQYFDAEHIPGSINIPAGQEAEFEARFDVDKEIVLYDAALEGPLSTNIAAALRARGFTRIRDFEGGLQEWRELYSTSAWPGPAELPGGPVAPEP